MASSLFSTYSTGENRVTASILAVLKSLSLHHMERLLGAILGESELELVQFSNQIAGDVPGVPDAMIASSFKLLIETKTSRNKVDRAQLERHLARFRTGREEKQILLVLTPDERSPAAIKDLRSTSWASFASLDQAIDDLLSAKTEVISEREEFLLRELQVMLAAEGLIGSSDEVLVVPARSAWNVYQNDHAYICQANRSFRRVKRIAFYVDGAIQRLVPEILEWHDPVAFQRNKDDGWLGQLINQQLDAGVRSEGQMQQVLRLSTPSDVNTIKLNAEVVNDSKSDSGKPVAFTQSQRYVSLEKLRNATRTSNLTS